MHHDDAWSNLPDEDAAPEPATISDREKLERIEQLVRKYCNCGVNVGAHLLAYNVLRIIEGET